MYNKRAIILISGSGSNMESIFNKVKDLNIVGVFSDRKCYGLERAQNLGLKSLLIQNNFFSEIKNFVNEENVDIIILAGFLKIIPFEFISNTVPIINIHPSLLPKYGGKGYYGMNVHKEVFKSKDKYSGATVHIVDNGIDTGKIIMQSFVNIEGLENEGEIASRVLETEHNLYSMALNNIIRNGGLS